MQKHSAVPKPAPVRVLGEKACSDTPCGPGSDRKLMSKTTISRVSISSSTPRTRALTSIFSAPKMPMIATPPRAYHHQSTLCCQCSAIWLEISKPKMP